MTQPTTAQLDAAIDQFSFWYEKATKLDNELAVAEQRIAELEAEQNEIGAKAVERIANVISEAMNELSIIDRILYARNIRIIQAAAAVIRREASRMRNRKASSYSENTEDVNIGWLQKASQGDAE
nr:hypothetical protein [uncultured Serratia sp.]